MRFHPHLSSAVREAVIFLFKPPHPTSLRKGIVKAAAVEEHADKRRYFTFVRLLHTLQLNPSTNSRFSASLYNGTSTALPLLHLARPYQSSVCRHALFIDTRSSFRSLTLLSSIFFSNVRVSCQFRHGIAFLRVDLFNDEGRILGVRNSGTVG